MIVYRNVYWSPQTKTGIIGSREKLPAIFLGQENSSEFSLVVSVALLSLGTFMLIPTPEDVLSVGWLARLFTKHYGISSEQGVLYGLLTVKGTAILLIIIASVLGGEYIRELFHRNVTTKVNHHRERLADWIRPK